MANDFPLGGVVIALIGFLLTRFTVTLVAMETTRQFLFAGVVPLVLGLSLAAFGIILTVGAYDAEFVRTTAIWCVLGTGTMLALVILTLLGSEPDAVTGVDAIRRQTPLSNFLIGGAIGGTLTGIYAARTKDHQQEVTRQANRLTLLNRLLRDEVINAATAIKGHAKLLADQTNERSTDVISQQADDVVQTVENVKYLTETTGESTDSLGPVDLTESFEAAFAAVDDRFDDTDFDCVFDESGAEREVRVIANTKLREVIRHLVQNAIEYSDADPPRVEVSMETTRYTVRITVRDNGPGLPEDQRRLLEEGEIAEYDDPSTGFGLNIVRLLVESFHGEIETSVTDAGSSVTIELPAVSNGGPAGSDDPTSTTFPGVSPPRIVLALVAGLAAGATMGVVLQMVEGLVPTIGALYGISDPIVGWITHEFHSVVFALVYAAILTFSPVTEGSTLWRLGVGLGLGLFLWVFAAGIVMPIWLILVGIPTQFPFLTVQSLAGHLTWGLTIALVFQAGDRWIGRQTSDEDHSASGPTGPGDR